jgi:hypothetical protein
MGVLMVNGWMIPPRPISRPRKPSGDHSPQESAMGIWGRKSTPHGSTRPRGGNMNKKMTEIPLEFYDVQQLKLWSRREVLKTSKVYYVDTSRTTNGKRRRKLHCVYDGQKILRIRKLTKLRNANEIYIDSLFPEVYDEVLELLKRGVKVYTLKDLRVLKNLRSQNNLRKSDEVDAQLLSMIPRDEFRSLTIDEIEFKMKMRPLINKYEKIVRWRKVLKKLLSQGFDYNFRESIRLMQSECGRISGEIVRSVADNSIYREACKLLGLKDSVEVAILTVELSLHLPLKTLKNVVGLTPNRNNGRYNGRIRKHLSQLAINIYINAKRWRGKWEVPEEFREIIDSLPQKNAIYRLQSRILKMFRKAYFLTNNQTVNNPAGR